jgi:hypothetical protein
MSLTNKGVRCGSNPKFVEIKNVLENYLIDKIDLQKSRRDFAGRDRFGRRGLVRSGEGVAVWQGRRGGFRCG